MQVNEKEAKMITKLAEKTGQSLETWIKIVQDSGISKHNAIIKFLKTEHSFSHGYANLVALKARQPQEQAPASGEALVEAQYAGDKADLRPIYAALIAAVQGFGDDVEIAPKKAYVSLRRKKQFGLIQPSTKTRVDLGINLKGEKPIGRLEASGSFNSMVSHRVRLESKQEVNAELKKWLKAAYDAS